MMAMKPDNEKVRRIKMEQMWQSEKKKFDDERWKFENEENDWTMKREGILMDRNKLAPRLKELRQQSSGRNDQRDSKDQSDSSLSTSSLISKTDIRMALFVVDQLLKMLQGNTKTAFTSPSAMYRCEEASNQNKRKSDSNVKPTEACGR
ncbi:hypothetical protein LOAG_12058 [Loa loa]|uniref:NAM-associated domain-containing protein n=1 Tax=Loa loa TaxID=7209 RepID=A0A1I7W1I3_LOALO|nr:hypothetical protein LOAG_12058 [Loa loa]EFO16446.1 hypothetical protein LOAG_12058 [Loa loa]